MKQLNYLKSLFFVLMFLGITSKAQVYIHAGSNRPNLVSNAGTMKLICYGESVQIGGSPSAQGGVGNYNYNWSPSTGLNSITIPNPIANPLATTTYTLTVTDSLGCQSVSQVAVNVKPLPNVQVTASAHEINVGGSLVLNAGGGQSYTWWPSTGLNTTTGSSVTASPLQNTMYHVLGTGANGCSSSDSIFIGVYCGKCPDTVMFATAGTFNSGCDESRVYNDNSRCKWLIFPSGASTIYISFPEFDILSGDKIRVWQGPDTTGVLIGTYDNTNYSSGTISTTVPMFVELISNSSDGGTGFKANYWTDINGSIKESKEIFTNIKIYPNPTNKLINIEFNSLDNKIELALINTFGKIIQTKSVLNNDLLNKESFDIASLPNGTYSVFIRSKNGNKSLIFLIQK